MIKLEFTAKMLAGHVENFERETELHTQRIELTASSLQPTINDLCDKWKIEFHVGMTRARFAIPPDDDRYTDAVPCDDLESIGGRYGIDERLKEFGDAWEREEETDDQHEAYIRLRNLGPMLDELDPFLDLLDTSTGVGENVFGMYFKNYKPRSS